MSPIVGLALGVVGMNIPLAPGGQVQVTSSEPFGGTITHHRMPSNTVVCRPVARQLKIGAGSIVRKSQVYTRLCLLRTGRVSVTIRRLVHLSWLGTSWKGTAGQGPAISHETGTRPKGVSYVYKYQ